MTLKNMSFAPLARLYVYLCAINMAGVLCSVCCVWERRFVIGGVLYYVLCERRFIIGGRAFLQGCCTIVSISAAKVSIFFLMCKNELLN